MTIIIEVMVLPGVPGYVATGSMASKYAKLVMRFQHWGCNNRPFYHIVVDKQSVPNRRQIGYMEQVGTYDPMPNASNEKLISLNLERIHTYIAGGVHVSCAPLPSADLTRRHVADNAARGAAAGAGRAPAAAPRHLRHGLEEQESHGPGGGQEGQRGARQQGAAGGGEGGGQIESCSCLPSHC